jgi:hypothetical protein
MTFDTFLGIAGIVLGLIGLASGYIFYRKSLRIKLPMYLMRTENLIRDNVSSMSGLKITYNDHGIANLSITSILFWNNGSETIDEQDRVRSNPLRVSTNEGVQILDAKIAISNNQANRLSVNVDEQGNHAYLFFDYLDKAQGGIIQVTHTGLSSDDLSLHGDIKGAALQKCKDHSQRSWPYLLLTILLFVLACYVAYMQPLGSLPIVLLLSFVASYFPDGKPFRYSISPVPKEFRGFWFGL